MNCEKAGSADEKQFRYLGFSSLEKELGTVVLNGLSRICLTIFQQKSSLDERIRKMFCTKGFIWITDRKGFQSYSEIM